MKIFYAVTLLLANMLGVAADWLWKLVVYWLGQPLGFAVVPLLITVWAPMRFTFLLMFKLLFFYIIPRFPVKERKATWPNR